MIIKQTVLRPFLQDHPGEKAPDQSTGYINVIKTSVLETIRKPPLVKAQTALKKIKFGKKRFSIWRMELLHPAMWHDHDIDFAR